MSAEPLRPTPSLCGYGVPRAQCRQGCGYICRRGDRAVTAPAPAASAGMPAELRAELRASLPSVRRTACCGGCDLPPGHAPCDTISVDMSPILSEGSTPAWSTSA